MDRGANLYYKLPNHNTALHIAAELGDVESTRMLIGAGYKDIQS